MPYATNVGMAYSFGDIEYAADDRLVAVMRADEREVLCGEEAQRIPRLVDHRTEQHLKSDVRIALQQIR